MDFYVTVILSRYADRGRRLCGRSRTRCMCVTDKDASVIGVKGDWRIAAQD